MSEPRQRVKVTAIFTKPGGTPESRDVELEYRDGGWIHMFGGPTGWESFHPGPEWTARDWNANAGDSRYANCTVPAAELQRALTELGVLSALRGAGDTPAPPLDGFVFDWISSAGHYPTCEYERGGTECDCGKNAALSMVRAALRGNTPAQEPLREALETIRKHYGQVCDEFTTCTHAACASSYGAWATADEALRGAALSGVPHA